MFTYVTSNREKIISAHKKLDIHGIHFESQNLDIQELQSDSVITIAESKAEQAFALLQKPIVVTDHGWSIPDLQGFPGPYMKYINQWFIPQDLLNLMQDKKDKSIIKTVALIYKDSHTTKQFVTQVPGRFLSSSKGQGLPAMTVVTFSDTGKSVAEMWEEDLDPFPENNVWDLFAVWIHNNSRRD